MDEWGCYSTVGLQLNQNTELTCIHSLSLKLYFDTFHKIVSCYNVYEML